MRFGVFHTLAYKLKADGEFLIPIIKTFIIKICNELPCPDCLQHAKEYLYKNPIENITTREELVNHLNNFHNEVNMRLGKPIVSIDDSNKLYSRAITNNIIQNYINIMNKSSGNTLLMMNAFMRKNTVEGIYKIYK